MNDKLKKVPARFYTSESGSEPVREWLLDLAKEERRQIKRRRGRLRTLIWVSRGNGKRR